MALLYKCHFAKPETWLERMLPEIPDLDMRAWPDVGDISDIDMALVWEPLAGDLRRYPNLRAIFSTSAGVDHIFADPELPEVPVCRIVDPYIAVQMAEYALYYVLRFHRGMHVADANRPAKRWKKPPIVETTQRRVGVLGLGNIGGEIARKLTAMGFPVTGWSRRPKSIPGMICVDGPDGFAALLGQSDIVVSVLPNTPQTRGLLDRRAFERMQPGAYLVNIGRGVHVVDADLLAALDAGHLAGAALDVFHSEPLPPEHRFWTHPQVEVTPHMAATGNPRTAAVQVCENIRRLRDGKPLLNVVDASVGY